MYYEERRGESVNQCYSAMSGTSIGAAIAFVLLKMLFPEFGFTEVEITLWVFGVIFALVGFYKGETS